MAQYSALFRRKILINLSYCSSTFFCGNEDRQPARPFSRESHYVGLLSPLCSRVLETIAISPTQCLPVSQTKQ